MDPRTEAESEISKHIMNMADSRGSFSSASSYGSRLEILKESKKDRVSRWTKTDLDEKNIFYNDEACSLSDFVRLVKDKVCVRRGHLFECPEDIPEFLHDLMNYTKENLHFTYDEHSVEDEAAGPISAALDEAWTNLEQFDSYSCKLVDEHRNLDHKNRKLLNSWCTTTETFLKCYKLFLSTKIINEKESGWEGQFQELLMNFTRIFFMTPELGQARKRELEINKVRVESVPDIHFIKDVSTPKLIRTLLVLCVEVKPDAIHESAMLKENFRANEMINSKVLGQHGGELLLEKTYSVFNPKVLGMICLRSKIIFTFMDLKQSHYDIIVNKGEVTDARHRCTIYYTKPYDFLIKSDRDQILEFLFWIGYVQTVDLNK